MMLRQLDQLSQMRQLDSEELEVIQLDVVRNDVFEGAVQPQLAEALATLSRTSFSGSLISSRAMSLS
jgi:hypothetical protein